MALYFVRHGETDWNRANRFQSTTDVPLNARGLAQARCVRDELRRRGVVFSLALCSPLTRAVRTSEIILQRTGRTAQVEPRFIELSFGGFEGRNSADFSGPDGALFARWRESLYTLRPPGGESVVDGWGRVRPALAALRPAAISGDVLIVAHQAVMMAMKMALIERCNVELAAGFKQNNDEIDIWDATRNQRIEMFKVECQLP